MAKFRTKLKKKQGGKRWARGQSSTSNPETNKHRAKAKSRFFQSNLSLAPTTSEKQSPLTLEAVLKHDAIQSYTGPGKHDPTVNDISNSMKSFTMNDDEFMSDSQLGTFKTFQTFASNYSSCTNMSFNKLMTHFRSDSELHKDMLAILAAITEFIKERGGSQSSAEYFVALMETIEATKEEKDTIAAVSLLSMGLKSVPQAVLRKKFNETGQVFLDLMERFVESDNQNILRTIIGCMSVLLRAQEYSLWKLSSTMKFFDAILAFSIHTKPKIRKAAQHAVVSVVHGSCFMLPKAAPEGEEPMDENQPEAKSLVQCHPVSNRIAKFCIGQFKPDNLAANQTLILHTLGLLHNALPGFNKEDVKAISENLLSIMTATNVLIRTTCFQTFHSLFSSKTENLPANLAGKLITALYDYRPDKSDIRQTIAWLTVLKEGHVFLAKSNLQLCSNSLARFVEVCTSDFWASDKLEVVSSASNALKEILYECVQLCCEDEEVEKHRVSIEKVVRSITNVLTSVPFGHAANHVLIILAILFDICGKHFGKVLMDALRTLGNRYDSQSSTRIQIEHAVLQAVGSMDTELFLKCIPLQDSKGNIDVNRSWLLPIMREGLNESSFSIFNNVILKLASQCYNNWKKLQETDNKNQAHIYELLCCQLWGLFPGFCRRPKDVPNFKFIAKTLGTVLTKNAELRSPVLDGLKELITNLTTDNDKSEVAKFAKNFLPLLFNLYTTKPTGSYENEIRLAAFETAKEYLTITPKPVLNEMFRAALEKLKSESPGTFVYDMVFDLVELLAMYQSAEKLEELYQEYISVILKRDKEAENVAKEKGKQRRQMKKAYKMLHAILTCENEGCVEFSEQKSGNIEKLLLQQDSKMSVIDGAEVSRLGCIKCLIEKHPEMNLQNKIITRAIPEAVSAFNNEAVKQANISVDLLQLIGERFEKTEDLNKFVDLIIAGFTGDSQLISNTIWVLRDVIQQFTGSLSIETLKFILEQVLAFVVSNNRLEVDAGVNFVLTYTKILPSPLVFNYLPLIVKSLSLMIPDTKRHCRLLIGYVLKKLCKRFSPEEVVKLVPGNDEVTHKRLRKIRKDINRAKRNKLEEKKKRGQNDDENEADEFEAGLEKKSLTIDDILADSESDSGSEDEEDNKNKSKKKMDTYIKESAENIVDLADLDAISKITTNQPMDTDNLNEKQYKKKKDSNRGFKTAPDGRLVIEDIEDYTDSDEDPDENVGYKDKTKKKVYDEVESESDEEGGENGPSTRKKKAIESGSMKSGISGSSRYIAGGKGIHRPVAASVKSGYSGKSMKSAKSSKSYGGASGADYKPKKAGGDVLKKGKHEPYAYVPLSRNSLNRRKRAKNAGTFKNIVKSARKGAAAGSKNRLLKTAMKKKK